MGSQGRPRGPLAWSYVQNNVTRGAGQTCSSIYLMPMESQGRPRVPIAEAAPDFPFVESKVIEHKRVFEHFRLHHKQFAEHLWMQYKLIEMLHTPQRKTR